MKEHIRVLGIDDSEFGFHDAIVPIVGVVVRAPAYIEGVLKSEVHVDGDDSNEKLAMMVRGSRYREQLRLILIDGVALGGFNVIDISRLYRDTGIAVATVTRKKPDIEAMKSALKKHFSDWEERYRIVSRSSVEKLQVGEHSVFTQYEGIGRKELKEVLMQTTVRGAIPEPVRIAHLIATAMARGESRGRA